MEDQHRFNRARYRHWQEDQVRFSDLDPLGHVNNNAIGTYFENARASLFAIVTPNWPWRDCIFVLAHSAIDFRQELHLPAKLQIGSCITGLGRTSMKLANAVFHEDRGIAYCENVSVLINQTTRQPVELDAELRTRLNQFLDGLL